MKKKLFTFHLSPFTFHLALLGVMLLAACGSKNIIDEERTFAGDVWNRFTPETFEVNVDNTDNYYNIDVTVTVDTALFRYSLLPITVNLYSPAGERRMFYASVPLKENGRWKGDIVSGTTEKEGRRQVTSRIRTLFSFNAKGTHRLEIGQATSQYNLEGIGSLRLTVENTKIDYKDL